MTPAEFASAPTRDRKAMRLASLEELRDGGAAPAAGSVIAVPDAKAAESSEAGSAAPSAEAAPLPKPRPEPKPVVWRTHEEICDTLTRSAAANDLPVPFFIRLLFQESGFHPAVVSHAGAQGIAQFMPATAAEMGLENPFDPLQAIPASARLLRNLFQQFGNFGLAAAAYNAGPGRIQNWLRSKKGVLPQETQGYVKVITGRPAETWRGGKRGELATTVPKRAPCQEAAKVYAANEPKQVPTPAAAPGRAQRALRTAARTMKPAKPAQQAKGSLQLAARKNAKGKLRLSSAK
ncbi:MAG: lytic transglycosylase domain-containing protein [Pseudolabrys sp.]